MSVFFLILSIAAIGAIFYQDLKMRAIWWFLPPVLFLSLVMIFRESFTVVGVNLAFITGLLLALTAYVRIRFGSWDLFRQYFGLGDALFLAAVSPLLQTNYFIWFFTAGTSCSLLIHLIVTTFRKQSTIPFAGYLCLPTLAVILLKFFYPNLLHQI